MEICCGLRESREFWKKVILCCQRINTITSFQINYILLLIVDSFEVKPKDWNKNNENYLRIKIY